MPNPLLLQLDLPVEPMTDGSCKIRRLNYADLKPVNENPLDQQRRTDPAFENRQSLLIRASEREGAVGQVFGEFIHSRDTRSDHFEFDAVLLEPRIEPLASQAFYLRLTLDRFERLLFLEPLLVGRDACLAVPAFGERVFDSHPLVEVRPLLRPWDLSSTG
ncbi:MAG TPA: hypothetical protein PLI18_02320 [Pirellulaceae bacterium]|nr:hypothetical protein [Pirellulaceae bacterium]